MAVGGGPVRATAAITVDRGSFRRWAMAQTACCYALRRTAVHDRLVHRTSFRIRANVHRTYRRWAPGGKFRARCMIGYGNCGAADRGTRAVSECGRWWMRNRPAVLRRAVRTPMMPARMSSAPQAQLGGRDLLATGAGRAWCTAIVQATRRQRRRRSAQPSTAYPWSQQKLYVASDYSDQQRRALQAEEPD